MLDDVDSDLLEGIVEVFLLKKLQNPQKITENRETEKVLKEFQKMILIYNL
jgi:hypothetical protein